MKNRSLLLILVGLLAGCKPLIQEVSPDRIPQTGRKLVVHCFISPQDTVLTALVGLSRNVLGVEDDFPNTSAVSNPKASVIISDGLHSRAIPFDPVSSQHRLNAQEFPIEAGKTYTLEVRMPDGMSVTAQTTVPRAIPLQRIQVDSVIRSYYGNYVKREPTVRGFWNDPAHETNYYRMEGKVDYRYLAATGTSTLPRDTTFSITNYLTFDNVPYYSDKMNNGREMASSIAPLGYLNPKPSEWNRSGRVSSLKISLLLLHIDEAYFSYQNVVREWNTDNPFAEPSLIPTNIKGGLGCFGSYSLSRQVIEYD